VFITAICLSGLSFVFLALHVRILLTLAVEFDFAYLAKKLFHRLIQYWLGSNQYEGIPVNARLLTISREGSAGPIGSVLLPFGLAGVLFRFFCLLLLFWAAWRDIWTTMSNAW